MTKQRLMVQTSSRLMSNYQIKLSVKLTVKRTVRIMKLMCTYRCFRYPLAHTYPLYYTCIPHLVKAEKYSKFHLSRLDRSERLLWLKKKRINYKQ